MDINKKKEIIEDMINLQHSFLILNMLQRMKLCSNLFFQKARVFLNIIY